MFVALLISLFLVSRASSIALLAASLVAEVVGTVMLLIFPTPVFLAVVTSASLVAASILPLAV